MRSDRLEPVLVRVADAGAVFLALFVVAARPLFSGLAAPLYHNIEMHLAIFMALLLVTLVVALRRRLALRSTSLTVALLAFVAATVLTASLADNRFDAMVRMLDLVAWGVLVFVLAQVVATPLRARLAVSALVATLALLAVHGLHQYFVGLDEIRRNLPEYIRELVASGKLPPSLAPTFIKRATSGDVFGTFAIANSFAGYLIVVLPVSAAAVLVYWRERTGRVSPAGIVVTLTTLVGLVVLVLTQSKGGMLALGAVVAAAGVLFALRRLRRRHVTAAALVLLAVLSLAQTTGKPAEPQQVPAAPARSSLGASAEVRVEYWKATLGIIRDHPWLGVGPGNFRDRYLAHRTPEGSETDYAHNDYLEVGAETGLVGLAAYLAIWVTWFVALRRRPPEPELPEETDPKSRLVPAVVVGTAGVLAIVFTMSRFVQTGETRSMLLVGVLVWVGVYTVQVRHVLRVETPLRHAGLLKGALIVGVCAFLAHSAIDFDLNVPGITAPLACVLAAALGLRETDPERKPRPIGPVSQISLTLVVAGTLACALALLLYPLMETSLAMQQARGAKGERAKLLREAEAARETGDMLLAEHKQQQADRLLAGEVRNYLRAAAASYPANPEPWMELADLEATGLHAKPDADRTRFVELIDTVKRLRPHDPKPYVRFTQVLLSQVNAADRAGRTDRGTELAAEALTQIAAAVERYPTGPQLVRMRAEILERLGRKREAAAEYAKALDYAERTSQKELKFTPEDAEDIRQRIEQLTGLEKPETRNTKPDPNPNPE